MKSNNAVMSSVSSSNSGMMEWPTTIPSAKASSKSCNGHLEAKVRKGGAR